MLCSKRRYVSPRHALPRALEGRWSKVFQQLSKRGLLGGWANRLAVPEPLGCLAYGFPIGVRERGSRGLSHTRYLLMQSVRGIGHWVDY